LKRLIDEQLQPGSPDQALAELVRAISRFERAPFEKERILARVRTAAASPRRRVWAVAAAVLVLSIAAMAAAAMGRFWVSNPSPAAPPASSPLASFAPVAADPVASAPWLDLPAAPLALADNAAAPVVPRPARETPSARLGRSVASRHPDGEDPAPVLEAIRALRSRGDAARASALLADYLHAHPHSVLSEDALALSIEAAVARHDSRSAAELARRYVDQFPNGRYKAFASQTARPVLP